MISIRSYLQAERQTDRQTDQAPFLLVQLLLDGLTRHAVEGAPDELARLREATQNVEAALNSHAPPSELLALATVALDALRQNNQQATKTLRQPVAELKSKVKMLTAAITSISSSSSENIQRLQKIRSQMLWSVEVKNIRSLRTSLSECLDSVLAQAERQRAEADRAAQEMHRSNQKVQLDGPSAATPLDAATGFPARQEAEENIAKACEDEADAFVVVMVVNQLQNITRSLGPEVRDAILQRFATFIRQQLPAVDLLFRWGEATVVALVRRKKVMEVRGLIEPLLVQRLTLKTGNPEVQVPISTRWTVLPLSASPRLLFRKIDSFSACE